MDLQRYLVVGLAKTGTTVISKTIQNTSGIARYGLEPKSISYFEELGETDDDAVVKILFDHWRSRLHLLDAVVTNELATDFTRTIFITRDPRAEVISRLHYVGFTHFLKNDADEADVQRWLEIFRRKEADPESVSLRDMFAYLRDNFGVYSDQFVANTAANSRGYAEYIHQRPILHADLLRYEDFIAGDVAAHPCGELLSGSREVGERLHRTRRSGGEEDWTSFVLPSDEPWLNESMAEALAALGYSQEAPGGPKTVEPERSSRYVERIIREARERRANPNKTWYPGEGENARNRPNLARRALRRLRRLAAGEQKRPTGRRPRST